MPLDPALVESIFNEALSRATPGNRAAYLDGACANNHELRRRVEDLLSAHDASGIFLPLPAGGADSTLDVSLSGKEGPGTVVGRYKILQQIGEGGFGTVFMAEQAEPVRRLVALKIIKLGMDTRQVVARFEAERQALAMMDHPNIAKVLDGGATDSGRPFFVMELVRGVPVTEYCDRQKLSIGRRLELFLQVCHAVQHAHQKGLIHRDIKPSNVLVSTLDDRPVAKVIDFGIAKATQARLTEKTLFTDFHQIIGTPEYMSPEQCGGSMDVDTRSDIYSLGVLLYELLTGFTPFDARELRSKAFAEIQRIIREVDPPTPSMKLSSSTDLIASVAAHRGTEPRMLNAQVRGELDWIVMKSLEKDRARRYESASSLAADLMHYLADEPVSAGAPSRLYRSRKFIRRHRSAVIASAAVLLALIAGTAGTTIGLVGQSRQRAIAEQERIEARKQEGEAKNQAAIAQAVGEFLSEMLASADPGKLLGDKVTVVQAVLAAVKELDDGKLDDQPLVEASVRQTIGETLRALGRYDEAERSHRRAVELRRRVQGPAHLDTAAALVNLASVFEEKGKFDEAEKLLRDSLEIRRNAAPGGHPTMMQSLLGLSMVLRELGRYPEGERCAREALELHRNALPPGHKRLADCLNSLALLLYFQGKLSEAEPLYREAVTILRKALPEKHPDLADPVTSLSMVLSEQGKTVEAETLLREALEVRRTSLPSGHRLIANSMNNLSYILRQQGRFPEAESLLRQSLEIIRRALPPGHPQVGTGLANLAEVLENQRKYDEAGALYHEALEIHRKALPIGHPDVARDLGNLARLLMREGKLKEAESVAREAIAVMRQAFPEGHPDVATCLGQLSGLYLREGKLGEAEPLILEALEIRRKTLPESNPGIAASLQELAELRREQKKNAEAESLLRQALEIHRKAFPPGHPIIAQCLGGLAGVLQDQGKAAEAEPLLRETLGILEASVPQDAVEIGLVRSRLGRALVTLSRPAEAEPELLEAQKILSATGNVSLDHQRSCLTDLVALYESWDKSEPGKGHDAQARSWKAKLAALEPESKPAFQATESRQVK